MIALLKTKGREDDAQSAGISRYKIQDTNKLQIPSINFPNWIGSRLGRVTLEEVSGTRLYLATTKPGQPGV